MKKNTINGPKSVTNLTKDLFTSEYTNRLAKLLYFFIDFFF